MHGSGRTRWVEREALARARPEPPIKIDGTSTRSARPKNVDIAGLYRGCIADIKWHEFNAHVRSCHCRFADPVEDPGARLASSSAPPLPIDARVNSGSTGG